MKVEHTAHEGTHQASTERKPYERPVLTRSGTLSEFTAAGSRKGGAAQEHSNGDFKRP